MSAARERVRCRVEHEKRNFMAIIILPSQFEVNLITLGSEKPCLFDVTLSNYSNRLKKDAAFQEVAVKLNMSGT